MIHVITPLWHLNFIEQDFKICMQSIKVEFISFRWEEGPPAVQSWLEQTELALLDSVLPSRTRMFNIESQQSYNIDLLINSGF